jgi:hypothetical protein
MVMVSNTRKVKNFAAAIVNHIENDAKKVSEEERVRRLEICKSCPLYTEGVCALCGCEVNEITSWESEDCPDDPSRWTGEPKQKAPKLPTAPNAVPMSAPRQRTGKCSACEEKRRRRLGLN